MTRIESALAGIVLLLSGCAHPAASYRLAHPGASLILIPPGVKDASAANASVRVSPGHSAKNVCAPSPGGLRIQGKAVIVSREALTAATNTELQSWTASLEKNGCIRAGQSFALMNAMLDSLPLEVAKRYSLRGVGTDLTAVNALRVVSPVLRPGAPADAGKSADETTSVKPGQKPGSIDVEVKSSADVTGYEVAWYDFLQRTDGPGFRIVPRNAEIHVAGSVEKKPGPQTNRFALDPDARWFRYFLMTRQASDRNDYNIVLLSGATAAELEARTEAFQKDATAYLRSADKNSYAAMTPAIGVNPYLRVTVNGTVSDIEPGTTVRKAIEQSEGRGKAAAVLPRLRILKPRQGRFIPVELDSGTGDVLNLMLEGGEEITW